MRDHRRGDEDDHRHRHALDPPLPPPGVVRAEAADRPAARQQQRRAAPGRQPAERHHEGRHPEPGDRQPLQRARRPCRPRPRRGRRGSPGCPRRRRWRRPRSGSPARPWRHRRATSPVSATSEPTERSMPAGQDHEGHADGDQPRDRHLPQHVHQVQRDAGSSAAAPRTRRPAARGRSAPNSAPARRSDRGAAARARQWLSSMDIDEVGRARAGPARAVRRRLGLSSPRRGARPGRGCPW